MPSDSIAGEALWTLRLTPILSSGVVASYDYEKAENATDNEIRTAAIDAGFIYDPSENLNITAGLGYEQRERLQTFSGERYTTEDNWGPAVRGSISYDTPEEFSLFANARYTTAAPSPRWTGDFRVDYLLPRGRLYARGYRDYGLDSEGDDTLFYGVGLGAEREINSLSSWGVDVSGRKPGRHREPRRGRHRPDRRDRALHPRPDPGRQRHAGLPAAPADRGRLGPVERGLRHLRPQLVAPPLSDAGPPEPAASPGTGFHAVNVIRNFP